MLAVAILVGAGAGYFAGVSNRTTVTSVSTSSITGPTTTATRTLTQTTTSLETIRTITTSTLTTTILTTTAKNIVGAENQCGFASTCSVSNSGGLELSLSVNSTSIRPNGTIGLNVVESNPLPVTVKISASSSFPIPGLWWLCGPGSFPHGIAIFRGYYTLSNVTTAQPLDFWAPISCAADYQFNGTRNIVGILQNVTSYSFMPENFKASFTGYYIPSGAPSATLGSFVSTSMMAEAAVSATNSNRVPHLMNSLLSTAPGVYTLVAGDEWGDLVLLHFRVA